MTTGEKIKEIRKQLGLTQKEVAEALGIYQSNISQIEGGNRGTITYETIARLSSVFSRAAGKTISVENLAGDDFPKEYFNYYHCDDGGVDWDNLESFKIFYSDILTPYLKLNGEGRKRIIEMANDLCEIEKYRRDDLN